MAKENFKSVKIFCSPDSEKVELNYNAWLKDNYAYINIGEVQFSSSATDCAVFYSIAVFYSKFANSS